MREREEREGGRGERERDQRCTYYCFYYPNLSHAFLSETAAAQSAKSRHRANNVYIIFCVLLR